MIPRSGFDGRRWNRESEDLAEVDISGQCYHIDEAGRLCFVLRLAFEAQPKMCQLRYVRHERKLIRLTCMRDQHFFSSFDVWFR